MAVIIIDGFDCVERRKHAEMLAATTRWRLTVPHFNTVDSPYWEQGSELWDYKTDGIDEIVDGFVLENWYKHGQTLDRKEIKAIGMIMAYLYRRDDILYHWCVTSDQCRSRTGLIERLVGASGLPFSVLDHNGNIAEHAPCGTWRQKIKNRKAVYPVDCWWEVY